jgi:hypothetical protein
MSVHLSYLDKNIREKLVEVIGLYVLLQVLFTFVLTLGRWVLVTTFM